jgi:hypothetical protein
MRLISHAAALRCLPLFLQKLYFCEYSLHFFKRRSQLLRHLGKCKLRHPPGDEIYRKDNISMFEARGWLGAGQGQAAVKT